MAFGPDPHRVLGLPPDASQADIKRAYRRLAKAFHPDTAGEAAIPRFLAIQAAYDLLTGSVDGSPGPASAGSRSAGSGRRQGWWTDPERARAPGRRAGPDGKRERGRDGEGAGRESGGRAGSRAGAAGTGSRSRRTNRQPGRATPGSTTYDEAEADPFDPEWSGGSWYGTTSGTYWTINPREYADPRKHGPEYQARARRRPEPAQSWSATGAGAEPAPEPQPGGAAGGAGAAPFASGEPAFASAGATAAAPGPPRSDPPPPADPLTALPLPDGAGRRVAIALVAWPPLGLAIAWLLGELSGCGRFAAGCVETFAVGTWVAQFAVLGALLLLPALASRAAVGTLAMLGAAIPAAVVLSAVGGAREPGAASAVLAAVLAIAWLGGVAFALVRRSRTLPS